MKFVAEKIEPGYSLEDAGHTPGWMQSATARAERHRQTGREVSDHAEQVSDDAE
jgi:hypothetical protein